MKNFADELIRTVRAKGNPCVMGLDPRIDEMPDFVTAEAERRHGGFDAAARACIADYHRRLIDIGAERMPAVKLQSAFYEQYGVGGWLALGDTVRYARERGMLVILDGKRNDIASTAEAYANALLGRTEAFGEARPVFDADAATVTPYLGADSLEPFIVACKKFGKGMFVVLKTSNKGSGDLQDLKLASGEELYMSVGRLVERCGAELVGEEGYSAVGVVVGATYPEQAQKLRRLLPRAIFLVPAYGAQGARGREAAACFDENGAGAIVSASRSLTYGFRDRSVSPQEFERIMRDRIGEMIADVNGALVRTALRVGGPSGD